MHCKSCEILVEENLKEIPGVQSVQVSLKHAMATVVFQGKRPTEDQIVQAVQSAGYDVGEAEKVPWISRDPKDYFRLAFAGVILLVLYFVAKNLGLFSLNVSTGNGNIWVVLLVGLVAGFSSCMALIGGLVLGMSARHSELHPEATTAQKFRPHLFFNAGRILGYAFFGGVIGLLGSAFQLSGSMLGILTIVVGAVMIFLGLKLIEIFPALKYKTLTLPKSLSRILGIKRETKEYTHKSAFTAGAFTFFLPCGFTQAMQLYAVSTGSFTQGALIMGLFALGTAPGLLGIGGLSSVFKGQKARTFFMVAGLAVIILGVFNISNATKLISWPTSNATAATNVVSNGEFQEVRMTQNDGGYSPSQFTVEAGKPVRWIVTSTSRFSCASTVFMPEYGIQRALKPGENIIEFTPTKPGQVTFSCSMGMYRGAFNVTEGKTPVTESDQNSIPVQATSQAAETVTADNVLKTIYTNKRDIQPNTFTAKVGQTTRLEIEAQDNGYGCMGSVAIRGLSDQVEFLEKGKTIAFNFTPDKPGDYRITCAMGVPRGLIRVQ